ncbi:hypothetical protein ACSTAY_11655 [Vreelandella alkaliphila]|nr:hypothetical protein [Halomonas humidisoli]
MRHPRRGHGCNAPYSPAGALTLTPRYKTTKSAYGTYRSAA